MKTEFEKRLAGLVNAMPRSIRFPYGQEAFGLTVYSAIPKYGRKESRK